MTLARKSWELQGQLSGNLTDEQEHELVLVQR